MAATPTAERVFQVARAAGVKERALRRTLASICKISPQAVRDWQDGSTKNIKHEHLVAISRHFGVTIDYLLTGRDDPEGSDAQYAQAVRQLRALSPDQRALFLRMLDAAASEKPGG